MKKFFLAWMILLAWCTLCHAQEHGGAAAKPGHEAQHAVDPAPHPTVPENPAWVRPVVTVILVMFVMACFVGILVRLTTPEEMPQMHAHDEHHGHKDPHGDPGLGGHDPHANMIKFGLIGVWISAVFVIGLVIAR